MDVSVTVSFALTESEGDESRPSSEIFTLSTSALTVESILVVVLKLDEGVRGGVSSRWELRSAKCFSFFCFCEFESSARKRDLEEGNDWGG